MFFSLNNFLTAATPKGNPESSIKKMRRDGLLQELVLFKMKLFYQKLRIFLNSEATSPGSSFDKLRTSSW